MKPSLAFVVAHFHPSGRVAPDLFELVRSLSHFTRRIVFVSTGISGEAAARLGPFAQVISRENFGYDFWSYRVGIEALGDLAGIDRLVILNSSFVTLAPRLLCAPFLGPVQGPCLHGLTRCDFGTPHLQSYWIAFEHRDLILSENFSRWWRDMTPVSDRREVISRYEMGMTKHFAEAAVPIRAAFQPTRDEDILAMCRMIASRRVSVGRYVDFSDASPRLRMEQASRLNPTNFLWDVLFNRHGILKIELLKNNHFNLGMKPLDRLFEAHPRLRAFVEEALAV